MGRDWSEADRQFYEEEWWPRLLASYSKSQRVQNAVAERFHAAVRERDAERLQIREATEAKRRRAEHAARMRDFRARQRAARGLVQEVFE